MKFKQVLSLMLLMLTFVSFGGSQMLVEESAETGEEEGQELIVA